jgi:hypothetical protein
MPKKAAGTVGMIRAKLAIATTKSMRMMRFLVASNCIPHTSLTTSR